MLGCADTDPEGPWGDGLSADGAAQTRRLPGEGDAEDGSVPVLCHPRACAPSSVQVVLRCDAVGGCPSRQPRSRLDLRRVTRAQQSGRQAGPDRVRSSKVAGREWPRVWSQTRTK